MALIEPTVFAVAAILAGVTAVALLLGRGRLAAPERARPSYLGPDPAEVEVALRRLLDAVRRDAGAPPLLQGADLDELARHHAHWMASADRLEAVDDQDRDVNGRRRSLLPTLAGPLDETRAAAPIHGGDADACAEALFGALDAALWAEREFTAGAVGVSPGGGRAFACVVVARRLATFDVPPEGIVDLDLALGGELLEAASRAPTVRVEDPDGAAIEVECHVAGGRFDIRCQPVRAGEHVVWIDGDVLFVFGFRNDRLP